MEKITLPSGLPGYECGEKSLPAVICLQEWWGVNPVILELAELIAARGYRVLVPDLYKGKVGVDAEEAAHLMGALDFEAACGEIKEAAEYLAATGSPKVAITGFCMGGALAFAAASVGAPVACVAPFYGVPDAAYFDVGAISVPVLAIFGLLDTHKGFSDPEAAAAAEAKMKAACRDATFVSYASADHGFMNALTKEGPAQMDKNKLAIPSDEDLAAAQVALFAFFAKHLAA